MKIIHVILITISLASCTTKADKKDVMSANVVEAVKENWQSEARLRIVYPEKNIPGLQNMGVHFTLGPMSDVKDSCIEVHPYRREGGIYKALESGALRVDTMVNAAICYPCPITQMSHRKILLTSPFSEHLYGVELYKENDTIENVGGVLKSVVDIRSAMAMLQLSYKSDDLRDCLDRVVLSGDKLPQQGVLDIFTGDWTDIHTGGQAEVIERPRLLNGPTVYNIYTIPIGIEIPLRIVSSINGKEYATKTMLPPMAPGSLIRLNLHKAVDKVVVSESWIDANRPLEIPDPEKEIEVKFGDYLQSDGSLSCEKDDKSVALVIDTDGVHGKAVSLQDYGCQCYYTDQPGQINHFYSTVDGYKTNGKINPTKADHVSSEYCIFYTNEKIYPENAALSEPDGVANSDALRIGYEKHLHDMNKGAQLAEAIIVYPGSYVPSLSEMARLYLSFHPIKGEPTEYTIEPLEGEYLTSTESGESTCYIIDFTNGLIDGSAPKGYKKGKVRLFYLF